MSPREVLVWVRRFTWVLALGGAGYLWQRFEARLAPGRVDGEVERVLIDRWAEDLSPHDRFLYRTLEGRVGQGWVVTPAEDQIEAAEAPWLEAPPPTSTLSRERILGRVVLSLGAVRRPDRVE